jgi:hypothetical protein
MVWVGVALEVPADLVDQVTQFWTGVTGGPLPEHLSVVPGAGKVVVRVPGLPYCVTDRDPATGQLSG